MTTIDTETTWADLPPLPHTAEDTGLRLDLITQQLLKSLNAAGDLTGTSFGIFVQTRTYRSLICFSFPIPLPKNGQFPNLDQLLNFFNFNYNWLPNSETFVPGGDIRGQLN